MGKVQSYIKTDLNERDYQKKWKGLIVKIFLDIAQILL